MTWSSLPALFDFRKRYHSFRLSSENVTRLEDERALEDPDGKEKDHDVVR